MRIHIEGMDLSGKTTLAANLMHQDLIRGNHVLRNNRLMPNNEIAALADKLRIEGAYNTRIIGQLYVAAVSADLHSSSVDYPENVVQDSTIILRSIAYHTIRNNQDIVKSLSECMQAHPTFDHSFYLKCDISERRRRLLKRQEEEPDTVADDDTAVVTSPGAFQEMDNVLCDLSVRNFGSIIIDTTRLSAREVYSLVNERIDK